MIPIRTARLALLEYKDGEKRYIIAPVGIQGGGEIDERSDRAAGSWELPAAQGHSGRVCDSQHRTDARARRPDGALGGRRGDVDVAG